MIKVKTVLVGSLSTNCYVISNDNNYGVIVDPGEDAEKIVELIENELIKPLAILLTHGHFDHISAVESIKDKYGIKVYAGKDEERLLANKNINLSYKMGRREVEISADKYVKDQDIEIKAEKEVQFKIRAIATPGHTSGGICYLFTDDNIIFTGDTLFRENIGRADFLTGSEFSLFDSINRKLMSLNRDVVVYPGHGLKTTIGHERDFNPFIRS